ncbi:hypothetical protein EPYR_01639 [Erwinia pyrifoliae DSM 12163]|nr:hypothetical protein EPYR_01639 [Erwinia pyrifoliae DSM 12163]
MITDDAKKMADGGSLSPYSVHTEQIKKSIQE